MLMIVFSSLELQHLQTLKRAFVTKTVDLYAQILEYQIRLAKHIFRSGFCRFFADLVVTDDWKAMLMNVKDIEGCIKEHLSTHDRNTLDKIHDKVSKLHGHNEEVLKILRVSKVLILVYFHTLLTVLLRISKKGNLNTATR
jgi:N-terminal domain of NWD NACHT-NTPase